MRRLCGENTQTHIMCMAKDNIPFHTIILPALLIANGEGWHLPDQIVSSEYMTLEGRKISTSQNYAIWVTDLIERYDPDSIRYYFLAKWPREKRCRFFLEEYVNSHNGELLGAYGNFVNRTLTFIHKYWNGFIPEAAADTDITEQIAALYGRTGGLIERGAFKRCIEWTF